MAMSVYVNVTSPPLLARSLLLLVRRRDGESPDVGLVVVLHGYGSLANGLTLQKKKCGTCTCE